MRVVTANELIDEYDAYVFDQWGVLHGGAELYPGVAGYLRRLKGLGLQVGILTNSSKSSERNRRRLSTRFGLAGDAFDFLVSSADLLLDGARSVVKAAPSTRILVIADEGDEQLLEPLASNLVDSAGDAELVVLLSLPSESRNTQQASWLDEVCSRGLPMLVPSRDVDSVSRGAVDSGMDGVVRLAESRGLSVTNFGKPEGLVYAECRRLIGQSARVLAFGDQIGSDVVGATRAGWDTVLVGTGVSAKRFPQFPRDVLASRELRLSPTFLLPSFD